MKRHLLIRILKKFNKLKYFNFHPTIRIGDKKFVIPIIKEIGYNNLFLSEPWMLEMLQRLTLLSGIKSFMDVGVNTGQTFLKVKAIDSDIYYIGFEPNPNCNYYIRELLNCNKSLQNNSYFVPVGLSDKVAIAVLNFFYDNSTDSSASIIENYRPEQKIDRKEFVPIFSYEDILTAITISNPDIVKIDVEGSELEVLKGLQGLLMKKRPIVLIEILPVYDKSNTMRWSRQKKIEKIFSSAHLQLFRIIKHNDRFVGFKSIINNDIGIHSNLEWSDYVAVSVEIIENSNFMSLIIK